jgi:CRISPR-associated protein Cas2
VSIAQRTWLVAYDIRDPRRLRRVHRALRKEGLATQYSLFTIVAKDKDLDRLLATLALLIDHARDDVRAYEIPACAQIWTFGRPLLPAGIVLSGDGVSAHVPKLVGDVGEQIAEAARVA